jgi:hypothetical protein
MMSTRHGRAGDLAEFRISRADVPVVAAEDPDGRAPA